MSKYILVDAKYAYGPFNNPTDAEEWFNTHVVVGITRLVSLYTPEPNVGTAEKAHHCGHVAHIYTK